jgi:hypothetical protein
MGTIYSEQYLVFKNVYNSRRDFTIVFGAH